MNKFKNILSVFGVMFKIGLFTFGGGYAMIPLIEHEFVEKKKWIEEHEFYDMLAIAECTPGPIAINSATYLGYKVAGIFGAVFGTLGVCIPSFSIIIALFTLLDKFDIFSIPLVVYAFKGVQVCVEYLILSAGIKMIKKEKNSVPFCVLTAIVILLFTLFTLISIKFSSILYILVGAVFGLVLYFIKKIKEGGNKQ